MVGVISEMSKKVVFYPGNINRENFFFQSAGEFDTPSSIHLLGLVKKLFDKLFYGLSKIVPKSFQKRSKIVPKSFWKMIPERTQNEFKANSERNRSEFVLISLLLCFSGIFLQLFYTHAHTTDNGSKGTLTRTTDNGNKGALTHN